MNESVKAVLGAIALMGSFFAVFLYFAPNGSQVQHYIAMLCAVLAAISTTILVFVAMRKDKVPDYLRAVVSPYFHRDGLSFAITVGKDENECFLDCYFQNRYSNECEALVVVNLTESVYRSKYPMLNAEFGIRCPEAGFGRCRLPIQVPAELQGQPVTFSVAAAVRYPKGRGKLLRFGEGIHVGEVKNNSWSLLTVLGALGGAVVITSPAKFVMTLPTHDGATGKLLSSPSTKIFWKLGYIIAGQNALPQIVQETPKATAIKSLRETLMLHLHLGSEKNLRKLPALQALHKEKGGSIVLYKSVASFGAFCDKQCETTWVAPCRSLKAKGAIFSFPTLMFGWWSPEGFFRTISALVYNLSGGCDITRLVTEPSLLPDSEEEAQEIFKVWAREKMIRQRFLFVLCFLLFILLVVIGVCVWKAVS